MVMIVTILELVEEDSGNGDDSHDSRTGRRRQGTEGVVGLTQWLEKMEYVFYIRNCTFANQVKFATCTLLGNALTWWNSQVKIVSHEAAYGMTWNTLKKMMTNKLRSMLEDFPTIFKKVRAYAERQAENKRKLDNKNQAQQQPLKQSVAIAYTVGSGERKEYAGTLSLRNKCKSHNNSPCTVKHYRSDCPELKNQNHGNQAGGTKAHGMVYALEGEETDQDLNNMEDGNHNQQRSVGLPVDCYSLVKNTKLQAVVGRCMWGESSGRMVMVMHANTQRWEDTMVRLGKLIGKMAEFMREIKSKGIDFVSVEAVVAPELYGLVLWASMVVTIKNRARNLF
nr:hypothetical protein [Tanacetum cinerariifolium]